MYKTIFDHTCAMFEAFEQTAETEDADGVPIRVFRGSIVDTYNSLGISQAHYSPVMRILKTLGCISVLSSGRRSHPSVVALHHPPDELEFAILQRNPLTGSPEAARLRARFESMEKQIGGINIAEALAQLEERVTRLERQVNSNQKEK